MARHSPAFDKLIGVEGGYVNHPHDPGGETIFGVSRRAHPRWVGWEIIDEAGGKPDNQADMERLRMYAKELYYRAYWQKIYGDLIPDQDIAEELYESTVNMGRKPVVKYLQRSINCLVEDELVVDGLYGKKTLGYMLKAIQRRGGAKALLKMLNACQCTHYMRLALSKKRYKTFLVGWVNNRT